MTKNSRAEPEQPERDTDLISKLQDQVAMLQSQVTSLENENSSLRAQLNAKQTEGDPGEIVSPATGQGTAPDLVSPIGAVSPATDIDKAKGGKKLKHKSDSAGDKFSTICESPNKRAKGLSSERASGSVDCVTFVLHEVGTVPADSVFALPEDLKNVQWSAHLPDSLPQRLVLVINPDLQREKPKDTQRISRKNLEALELNDIPDAFKETSSNKYSLNNAAYVGLRLSMHLKGYEIVFCEVSAFLAVIKDRKADLNLWNFIEERAVVCIGPTSFLPSDSPALKELSLFCVCTTTLTDA